jgi:hypothetical protein
VQASKRNILTAAGGSGVAFSPAIALVVAHSRRCSFSFRPQIRLDQAEAAMVAYLCNRDNSEPSNPSELFRLLLHREFNRCNGLPKSAFNRVASEARIGRPVAK